MENFIPKIISQNTRKGLLKFFCTGKIPEWRAKTILTKEPETISWIDTFRKKDVFWDIGANVGTYSLYAGLSGINVLSFEPSPANFYLLTKNIEINGMDNHISAFCIVLPTKPS